MSSQASSNSEQSNFNTHYQSGDRSRQQNQFDHDKLRDNLTNQRNWVRLVYMLIFGIVLHVCGVVMWLVCVIQFLFVAFTGQDNVNLRRLASSLTHYIHQALEFVSYNSEYKPFPFSSWSETQNRTHTEQAYEAEWEEASDEPASSRDRDQTAESTVIDVEAESFERPSSDDASSNTGTDSNQNGDPNASNSEPKEPPSH